MADDKSNADLGGESSSCSEGSTDQTAVPVPQESKAEKGPSRSDHEDQILNSPNPESTAAPRQALSICDILFQIRRFDIEVGGGGDSSDVSPLNRRRNPRGPASRILPPESCFFIKKLDAADVSEEYGRLDMDLASAVWIHCCPRVHEEAYGTSKSVEITVFDYQDTHYNMVLTGYNHEGSIQYCVDGEWTKFLRAHDLKHGDVVLFYRSRDKMINGNECYYVILFSRASDGEFIIPNQDKNDD